MPHRSKSRLSSEQEGKKTQRPASWLELWVFGILLSVCFGVGESVLLLLGRYFNVLFKSPLNAVRVFPAAMLWYGLTGTIFASFITVLLGAIRLINKDRITYKFRYYAMLSGLLLFPAAPTAAVWVKTAVLDWMLLFHPYSLAATALIIVLACVMWFCITQFAGLVGDWLSAGFAKRTGYTRPGPGYAMGLLLFAILGSLMGVAFPVEGVTIRTSGSPHIRNTVATCEPRKKPNVVLITMDALRANHLSCYGYGTKTSPFIDELASKGVLFERCFAQSSWTYPSMTSLFTSTYPRQHDMLRMRATPPEKLPTLAQVLGSAGYETASFGEALLRTSHFGFHHVMVSERFPASDADVFPLLSCAVFQIGRMWCPFLREKAAFYFRDDLKHWYVEAETMNETVGEWLQSAREPFFLHVNYNDPHQPYTQHPVPPVVWNIMSKLNREHLIGLYDGEIAYLSRHLESFIKNLAVTSPLSDTLIIVTADHGEQFLEHGGYSHGRTLYDELIHIPLLVVWQGKITPGKRAEQIVRHIDITPTILDLLGIEIPSAMMGKPLSSMLFSDDSPDRPALSQVDTSDEKRDALRVGRYKLIVTTKAGQGSKKRELYDCQSDPQELRDISSQEPYIVQRLEDQLNAISEGVGDRDGK
jgi:arylsulfatase A-like enzyme